MPKVFNWQIGREMEYPYEERRPEAQFAAIVFDLNKCIACQTCTLACKTAWTSRPGPGVHVLEQRRDQALRLLSAGLGRAPPREARPRRSGRRHGEYQGKTLFEAAPPGGARCFTAPTTRTGLYPNVGEDDCAAAVDRARTSQMPHDRWFFYLPRTCAHCTYPACLAACPRKAIYKREEDGIVLIDQTRCKGYGECVRACPYKKSMYNPYTRVSEKCIGCYPAVEEGYQPMCVELHRQDPHHGLHQPALEGARRQPDRLPGARQGTGAPVLSAARPRAQPLLLPPIHAEVTYLRQMFGPLAEQAIANYAKVQDDPVARGLLVLMGSTDRILHSFRVENETAIGFAEDGSEIVRVPVTEPLYVRAAWDEKVGAVRTNTP
jgi:nitrate reductase / nitrite oxidoreductase, beta subunit